MTSTRYAALEKAASDRILILDGAMGTMIQQEGLGEADFRGEVYKGANQDLKGNNDLLSITRPKVIAKIHRAFFDAGADIIETNSFNGTSISQADYGLQGEARRINLAAAKVARDVADAVTAETPDKPRFVAGSIGPMNKTLSVSPDVNNPGYRDVTFDEVVDAYREQVDALMDGDVDLLLIETVFDTLNAKAAIFAAQEVFEQKGYELPLMLSGTVTDMAGRNLSGQTVEAFWYSLRHAKPFSVGLNCSFGSELLRPHAVALATIAETRVCVFPNAGLPNEMGEYDETAEMTAKHLKEWAEDGLLNIVGGCCGTTPDHIRAIADAVADLSPREPKPDNHDMRLSGLEGLRLPETGCSSCQTV